MLLDPFEEEFDVPTGFVQLCDGQSREFEIVGQEYEPLVFLCIVKPDASKRFGIFLRRLKGLENNGVVALYARGLVDRM